MATKKPAAKAAEHVEEVEVVEKETATKTEPLFDVNAYYNEPVTINLFKDDGKYKDDVFVAVNGKRFQIQRGKDITVPRYVAEVIKNAKDQRGAASAFISANSKD